MVFSLSLLLAVIVGGAVCGIVAVVQIRKLRHELRALKASVDKRDTQTATESARQDMPSVADVRDERFTPTQATKPDAGENLEKRWASNPDVDTLTESSTAPSKSKGESASGPNWITQITANLRDHWMIWLGGGCVTLAGIFLVRYSIDSGLLGPTGRIVFALLLGISFHAVSEFLRRKTGSTQLAFSALAGAGSITVYAALLAAVRLYDLIEPGTAFICMAIVAAATMAMALIHGPVLAAFGIVGAYLVPILLSTGSGAIEIALIYAIIVSASALLLLRYVYRPWLWWGFFTGAIGWWLISTGHTDANGLRTLYLTMIAYLIAAIANFDWLLRHRTQESEHAGYDVLKLFRSADPRQRNLFVAYAVISIAVMLSVYINPNVASPWLIGLPFFVLSLRLATHQASLFWLPWLTAAGTGLAWMLGRFDLAGGTFERLADNETTGFLAYLAAYALIASVFSLWQLRDTQRAGIWASLAALVPMLLLTLAYLIIAPQEQAWFWGLGTAVFAAAYMVLATSAVRRSSVDSLAIWLFVAGHYGLALAAAMVFDAASLTVAIAAQMVSLAWVIRAFNVPELGWLLKLVVVLVIARLTFNPWLLEYTTAAHWSLWTYGGSTLLAVIAAKILHAQPRLAQWAEGAALHLLVLTIWSEVRYWLYDGSVYDTSFTFVEAAVMMFLFGLLALVYHQRAKVSDSLRRLYALYSSVLTILAIAIYALILMRLIDNDSWLYLNVGDRPILNLMTFAFGVPIALGLLYATFYLPQHRRIAMAFSGVAAFVFVSLQIRHLWTGSVNLATPASSDGELYTYSIVWLCIALSAMLAGSFRFGQDVYRAGMVLLALVIAKLFLVDMSGLEGLLRVASFMGLGLSLLGIHFLHQHLQATSRRQAQSD